MTFKDVLKERLHHDLGFGFYRKDESTVSDFRILAKGPGILCGMIFVPTIVELVDKEFFLKPLYPSSVDDVHIYPNKNDGDAVFSGDTLAILRGNAEVLLKAERTICDYLSRLSGIATYTAWTVNAIKDIPVIFLDTRKHDSLSREENKYALRIGGAKNHRAGFFDGTLVKDNDITVYGGIIRALDRRIRETKFLTKAEVEVATREELLEVLKDGRVDVILLDNMSPNELREAVQMIHNSGKRYFVEASGIGDYDLREIAMSGVSHISLSSLVTEGQARKVDISMKAIKK